MKLHLELLSNGGLYVETKKKCLSMEGLHLVWPEISYKLCNLSSNFTFPVEVKNIITFSLVLSGLLVHRPVPKLI